MTRVPATSSSPISKAALAAKVSASMANAQPAPALATGAPESTGPISSPAENAVARRPLASPSRSGTTTSGSSPVVAGAANPLPAPVTPASRPMASTLGRPRSSQAASDP